MSLVKRACVLVERNLGRPGEAELVDRVLD
jgi:hypothetical protein